MRARLRGSSFVTILADEVLDRHANDHGSDREADGEGEEHKEDLGGAGHAASFASALSNHSESM